MQLLINGKVTAGEVTVTRPDGSDMIVALTTCCEATGKGSMIGDRPAVVCRNCYREVDVMFGDFAVTADDLVIMLQGFASEIQARTAHNLLSKEA